MHIQAIHHDRKKWCGPNKETFLSPKDEDGLGIMISGFSKVENSVLG
jgi:hypothetical protein